MATTDSSQRRFRGCAGIDDFDIVQKLGEGTFGVVSKARSKRSGAIVALKKILIHNEKDGFPITALREIKLLKMLSHPNVLTLQEMAVERHKSMRNFCVKTLLVSNLDYRRRQEARYPLHGLPLHGS
jgi:serine/threonine-protein kinase BUR1